MFIRGQWPIVFAVGCAAARCVLRVISKRRRIIAANKIKES